MPFRLANPESITIAAFRDCRALNNSGSGFGAYLLNVKTSSKDGRHKYPLGITFENCSIVGGNGGWSFGSLLPDNPGSIVVRGGEVRGTSLSGVRISAKALSSAAIRFEDHRIVNVATGNISVRRSCPWQMPWEASDRSLALRRFRARRS